MRQITLAIPDKKYSFFMDLIDNLRFVKKVKDEDGDEPTTQQILLNLDEAVEEVNLIRAGKLKGIAAKDVIDEL